MIKHEQTDTRSANTAIDNTSDYGEKRKEYEKSDTGVRPRDMIHFETTTEMIAFQHKNRPSSQEKANLSHTANMNYTPHAAKTDVEKNIDEAERYINQMAKQNSGRSAAKAEQKSQKPLPSTTELNAFAPKLPFEEGNTSVYAPKSGNSDAAFAADEPTRAFHIGNDTDESTRVFRADGSMYEPTRAFRVDDTAERTRAYGIGGITGQTHSFSSLGGVTGQTRAYRSAGVITEQTRAYQTGGAITEQTKAYGIAPEADEEINGSGAFSGRASEFDTSSDMDSANDTKDAAKPSGKAKKKKEAPARFEYTSPMQNKKIASDMETHCKSVLIRLCSVFFWAIALFLMENVGVVRELFPTRLSYVTVDWVITLVCAMLALDRLIEAVRSIIRREPGTSCITVLAFLFSIAATAAVLFEKTDVVTLCNFPFAVCVVLDLLFLYYKRHRDMYSFSLLASSRDKRAIVIGDSENENLSEAEYSIHMGKTEKVKFGAVKDVDFIDGYFAHAAETPKSRAPMKIFIPVCFAVSVIFFCASFWIAKHSGPQSLNVAYTTFMMCAPCAAFIAYCYPLYLAARRAHTYHSAILCDQTPDAYSDVSMVVFRDTEAIPSGKAKVKSIRLYGDRKIDNAIYYASSIYSAVGGPLAEVFRNAALNSVSSDNVQILEVSSEGVCAMVDDKNIVIGRPSYMEEQCFETMYEAGDDEYDGKTNKRILYLACDQFIIAKFYIQYSVSTDFLYIANRLLSAGYGISVRTADPCLDDGIFYENKIDPEQNAIRISRACLRRSDEESVPASRAGIVSCGDTKELTKTLLLCKKLENVRRTNLVLNIVASVFGVAVMALVTLTGNVPFMLSVYPALYQLFWILPTYFVSKVYL